MSLLLAGPLWDNPPAVGTPIRFLTGGLKGATSELDGVVDEILLDFAVSVVGEDGTYWLVLQNELVSIH
jgi:hypothetical protein